MRLVTLSLSLLTACTQSDGGPARVVWDRDPCKACGMVISDRHFATQIHGGPKGQIYKFDDIGCALKWLDQQEWANEQATRIWVARQSDGTWLDGKAARYVDGKTSPMGFNFGAVDGTEAGRSFQEQQEVVRKATSRK